MIIKPPTKREKIELLIVWALFVGLTGLLWWTGVLPYIDAFARLWAPMGMF